VGREAQELPRNKATHILPDTWMRDPYIVIGPDELYYLTYTNGKMEMPVWKSSNLSNWEKIGEAYSMNRLSFYDEIQEKGGSTIRMEEGLLSYKQDSVHGDELVYNELNVPLGGECNVILDDGTRVWVNAGSKIKYPVRFAKEKRVVSVKGEVYFDVTKDGRPFVVETELGKVNVLGTSFGVRAYNDEAVLTTLVSGKVMFTSKQGKSVTLLPREQAVASPGGALSKREVNVEEYVGWKDGWYIFKEERLEDVMCTLSRWYGITIFYQNPKVKEIRFTGNLKRYDSIITFLEVLAASEEVKYKIDGDVVFLYE